MVFPELAATGLTDPRPGQFRTAPSQPIARRIPAGADLHHWPHPRVRGGENNAYFAFANVCDAANFDPGVSGVFGPDTSAFPRREAIVAGGEGIETVDIDTSNLDSFHPTNVVRRQDLVPHADAALVSCAGATAREQFLTLRAPTVSKWNGNGV